MTKYSLCLLALLAGCGGHDEQVDVQVEQFGVTVVGAGSEHTAFTIRNLETGEPATAEEAATVIAGGTLPESSTGIASTSSALKIGGQFGKLYVFFRGGGKDTDVHPLRPCVSQPVEHVHLYIKKSASTPDDQAYARLHIGKYTDGGRSCAVVFDAQNPWVCLKSCWESGGTKGRSDARNATRQELQKSVQDAAVRAGVVTGAAAVTAIILNMVAPAALVLI